jgi:hypothetical protein
MALGELLVEEAGTITGLRVLPATAEGANYEICLSTEGMLRGTKITTNWTYLQLVRTDGSIYGTGDGVCTTECGQTLHLKGSGSAAGPDENGSIPMRVINHYHTNSEKFADLNGVALVGEYDVKPDGTTAMKLWHWK